MYGELDSLLLHVGFEELYALAPGPGAFTPGDADCLDSPRILRALTHASDEADSYLATRYAVPVQSPPPALIHFVGLMAVYQLTGGNAQESDSITRRYQEALEWLKGVAAGRINLPGLPLAGEGTAGVVFEPGKREW